MVSLTRHPVYKTSCRILQHILYFLVEPLNRQPHDVEIATLDACNTDVAYPLLNTISPSLVERLEMGDVIVDLLIRELLEGNIRSHSKTLLPRQTPVMT